MKIKYESGTGMDTIDLSSFPYLLQAENIFNFKWDYKADSLYGLNGGRITKFYRNVVEIPIRVYIHSESTGSLDSLLNGYRDVLERDIANLTPGKLWVNGQYLVCYIHSSDKSMWGKGLRLNIDSAKIVTEYPFWCREEEYLIESESGNLLNADFLDYPHDYEYDYSRGQRITIDNKHFGSTEFKLTFYGECVNPALTLGTHRYEVATTLREGERVVIDSRNKTIIKTKNDGEKENCFNCRSKEFDIFKKIPRGLNSVGLINSKFCSMRLIYERSEPIWSL